MAWELEKLMASFLVLISCAGDQGCSVTELLEAVHEILSTSDGQSPKAGGSTQPRRDPASVSQNAAATIWKWLAERDDVSVGPSRKYNHFTLDQIKASCLPAASDPDGNGEVTKADSAAPASASEGKYPTDMRVFTSEENMWQAITGHAVDYKHVPKSEWSLLLGIASTKSDGILQGDLGRLVDQDKRSVPKRTDSLVTKGYIVKRTVLVRGTKTSKLWLKLFAPPIPKEDIATEQQPQSDMSLSRRLLVDDLDPVPWHAKWTGETVDYPALATTIMATSKEWGVMRLQDLKLKLGVNGMRWQMKVMAKVCRSLNNLGVIEYVAAMLEDRIFKSCIRFVRDLNAEDWSSFLATGKRLAKPAKTVELGPEEAIEGVDRSAAQLVTISPPWSIDNPLAAFVTQTVRSAGKNGLTNPVVYALTMGSSFTRFLSTMTMSIATPNLQPSQLKYLQLRSQHMRDGKVARYQYFVDTTHQSSEGESETMIAQPERYGFATFTPAPRLVEDHATFTLLCAPRVIRPKQHGRPKRSKALHASASSHAEAEPPSVEPLSHREEKNGRLGVPAHVSAAAAVESPSVQLAHCSPRQQAPAASSQTSQGEIQESTEPNDMPTYTSPTLEAQVGSWRQSPDENREERAVALVDVPAPAVDESIAESPSHSSGRGRGRGRGRGGRGRGRGRGRGGSVVADSSLSYQWKCEKCGGTWKNDIGLKYHVEKSQSSCNPSYVPRLKDEAPRGRKKTRVYPNSPTQASPDDLLRPSSFHESASPASSEANAVGPGLTTTHRSKGTRRGATSGSPSPTPSRTLMNTGRLFGNMLESRSDWRRLPTAHPDAMSASSRLNQGALMQTEANLPRKITVLRDHTRRMESPPKPQNVDRTAGVLNLAPTTAPYVARAKLVNNTERQGKMHGVSPHASRLLSPTPPYSSSTSHARQSGHPGYDATQEESSKMKTGDRISHMIQTELTERNGAMLGGEDLREVISTAWNKLFADEPAPSARQCQLSLGKLLRSKTILEHWHGFRTANGKIHKCQIVTLPGIDAFSPKCLEMVNSMKERQNGNSELMEQVSQSQVPHRGQSGRGRGRRSLPQEVAMLDAPVYAAQLAAKRESDFIDNEQPRKRQKRRRDSEDIATAPPTASALATQLRESWHIRWASDRSLGDFASARELQAVPSSESTVAIQFLSPNTFLEDEPSRHETVPKVSPAKKKRGRFPEIAKLVELSTPEGSGEAVMVDPPLAIWGNYGLWPYLDSTDRKSVV